MLGFEIIPRPYEGFVKYSFKEDESEKSRGNNKSLQLEFWKGYGQYFVTWEYDKAQNIYAYRRGFQLRPAGIAVQLLSEAHQAVARIHQFV